MLISIFAYHRRELEAQATELQLKPSVQSLPYQPYSPPSVQTKKGILSYAELTSSNLGILEQGANCGSFDFIHF